METLTVLALVALGAAAFVALGVFLSSRGEPEPVDRPTGPRKRRWPRVLGGLALVVLGGMTALTACSGWALIECENSYKSAWWPLESRGNAVAITSFVLEFESGTTGFLCENDRALVVRARARPSGGKPVFVGAGGLAALRRYLGAGGYEIAATWMGLDDTHGVGDPARRLAPPAAKPFWRSGVVFPTRRADALERMTHEWRALGAEPFSKEFGTLPKDRFWLVVMNADGSPGMNANLRYEVALAPRMRWPWLIGVAAGLGLVVVGIVLAIRRPARGAPNDG